MLIIVNFSSVVNINVKQMVIYMLMVLIQDILGSEEMVVFFCVVMVRMVRMLSEMCVGMVLMLSQKEIQDRRMIMMVGMQIWIMQVNDI